MAGNDGIMLVTYASLDDAANQIDAQAKRLDEALEAIQTKIRSVSSTWEGEAKTAADGAHAKWDQETRAIHNALQSISKAVRQAAPAYQAGDKRAAGFF
ncbi:WXG100 family type VII secretion target [Streptomyces sp. NPDC007325]|uniref:WXG100 family type VII secretion target n=1 Tax=unclassified Streptomyces TaxID=2593676 RepID=UPI0033FD4CA2